MRTPAVFVAVLALCACTSSVPPPPGEPVPYTVVSKSGPPAGRMDVIADASVDGLNGLEAGWWRPYLEDCSQGLAWCWSSSGFPTASAAFGVEVYQGCSPSDLIGAYLSGSTLAFDVNLQQQQCPPGVGALAQPTFQLVAISRSDLPAKLLRVRVYYAGVASSPTGLIDLRTPMPEPPAMPARQAEVDGAILLAESAGAPGGAVTGLAARKFAAGTIACAPPAPTDSQPGYVICFEGDAGEYDYAAGRVVHCPAPNL